MSSRIVAGHLKICDGQILWADEDAHHLLAYAPGTLADMPFSDVYEPSADAQALSGDAMPAPVRGVIEHLGVTLIGQNGQAQRVDMRGERMEDRCILWTFVLASRGLRGERLEVLSRRDALTRLPNRIPSTDELASMMQLEPGGDKSRLLAVCYLDIDRLRDINDRFGPAGGDTVLREMARRIKTAVPPDAVIARVGGDEFALVMSFASRTQCDEFLRQLLARLTHPYRLLDRQARLRLSVGVSLMPWGEQPTEVMLQHAQHAVFLAKRPGGNHVHYFDAGQVRDEQLDRQTLALIKDGLGRDEFFLAYQPKVDMRCGRVIGFEALIRWQHSERGLLQPSEFVHLIEDHELVEDLGDWAIGEAIRQAAEWFDQGVRTSVSVNISPRHMLRPDFVQRLEHHLARYPELPIGVLELEILETTAIKDFVAVAQFIGACTQMGVPVTMDDFGTGYSSLSYLRRLPLTALKLDQSFVNGMLDDAEDRAIVEGILLLARALGRTMIAEGVESVAHGHALLALGCTLGQGYGIAKPLSAAEVPEWIAGFERAPPWGRAADCA
ncbi:putative bifunctional diguanylate cyclase/phosphodiesterase [Variovorax ginsengisoli]|uniref:Diguanylate cyclase (GGDEF)-like protein n=1 Tax=Variovorax ginsengisoli TaxID=363844 RepID=A0ABT9S7Y5_9BURK|nr:bifunctional diguanylate cyclase/phosphodiesterase [Variovorax ginsengisoli]MDP9900456.1 diguanylate cyclase (GGDEF)-like protein [Variovorax ginsengisoli]